MKRIALVLTALLCAIALAACGFNASVSSASGGGSSVPLPVSAPSRATADGLTPIEYDELPQYVESWYTIDPADEDLVYQVRFEDFEGAANPDDLYLMISQGVPNTGAGNFFRTQEIIPQEDGRYESVMRRSSIDEEGPAFRIVYRLDRIESDNALYFTLLDYEPGIEPSFEKSFSPLVGETHRYITDLGSVIGGTLQENAPLPS